jgi:trehalose 6-phosphate phosphatase
MDALPKPGDRWALFLDLDGTLLDLAPRPDLVAVPYGLIALLERLASALQGAVAIVSGRPLAEVDGLLHPLQVAGAGEHGAFCRLPSGDVVSPQPPGVPAAWRARIDAFAAMAKGIVVEQKASAVAVHYRAMPDAEPALLALLKSIVAPEDDSFTLSPAHMCWEIRPRGIDKGTAVRRLMREKPFLGRRPVFVGDDVTDEDGMRAAEALGGIGIDVRERFPTGASGVRAWLATLDQHLAAQEHA